MEVGAYLRNALGAEEVRGSSALVTWHDPTGDPRDGSIANKFRVAVAEGQGTIFKEGQTY